MYLLDDELNNNNLTIAALHLQIDAIRNGVITVDNPAKLIQHYEQQIAVLESRSSLGKRNQIAIQQNIADLPLSVRYNAARNYSTLYKLAQSQSVFCIIKPYEIDGSTKEVVVIASVECGTIKVGTIDIEYFSTDNIEEFERLCQKYDLSYIIPNETYIKGLSYESTN